MIRDLDGSLTGTPNVAVAKWNAYYVENADCEIRPQWNFTVCNEKFIKVEWLVFGFWPQFFFLFIQT